MLTHAELLPGRLWREVRARSARALESGALRPIPTRAATVEEAGIPFLLRVVDNLTRKRAARSAGPASPAANPFLPPDPLLLVGAVSDTHLGVLNRFNVLDDHLLIVTRSFAAQEALLDGADFEALAACLAEGDALGFYNAGALAGASQPHKHLQLVPLPLDPRAPEVPIERRLGAVPADEQPHDADLPFQHGVIRWSAPAPGARDSERLRSAYQALLAHTHALDAPPPGAPSAPYNLLVTRRWMLLVPRSVECFEGVSINALGFAGALLVKSAEELGMLKERGLLRALGAVARRR
jgi:ATP adenylyltransferase